MRARDGLGTAASGSCELAGGWRPTGRGGWDGNTAGMDRYTKFAQKEALNGASIRNDAVEEPHRARTGMWERAKAAVVAERVRRLSGRDGQEERELRRLWESGSPPLLCPCERSFLRFNSATTTGHSTAVHLGSASSQHISLHPFWAFINRSLSELV